MNEDDIPTYLEDIVEDDSKTDVTEQYEEVIDMLVTVATNRTPPIPAKHIVVYTEDVRPDVVVIRFVVDVSDRYFDDAFAFEFAVEPEILDAVESGDDTHDDTDIVMQSFNRSLRSVQDSIWNRVVNVDQER